MKYSVSFFILIFSLFLFSCNKDLDIPQDGDVVTYGLSGTFSVASDRVVAFAPGNLQYNAVSHKWRFAESQYDFIGSDNANIGSHYNGWIDLFGWGTSGFMVSPYCASTEGADGNNYDWGRFNNISNSGSGTIQWRTLTSEEWEYLLEKRAMAESKYGLATVCDVPGLVIVSDIFKVPERCTFVATFEDEFASNIYNSTQWKQMEEAGAIFLPAAGNRTGTTVDDVGGYGAYWTSTYDEEGAAFAVCFDQYQISLPPATIAAYYGHSVRLVRDVNQ